MGDSRIHFTSYWEPSARLDIYAPRGIRLWAQVLRDRYYDNADVFTYFGKISITDNPTTGEPRLGLKPDEIPELNRRVQVQNENNGETHLYMWTASKDKSVAGSLHVGKVAEVSLFRKEFLQDQPNSPIPLDFYRNIVAQNPEKYHSFYGERDRKTNKLFPIWFKLTDIRAINDFGYHKHLRVRLPGKDYQQFDPNQRDHRTSPLLTEEHEPKTWFHAGELSESEWKGWWEEVLLGSGDWDPGQFHNEDLKQVYGEALRFAGFNVPILVLGDRGIGKTFLARWIRRHSPFQNEEFFKTPESWPQVACGSFLNEELLLSELFGHKQGAFTGALFKRGGLLAALDGDTLFLDEIGDLSRPIQRALIKPIEEKHYKPVGSDRATGKSRFRLITATNKRLAQLRRDLDPDFFDRISDVVLRLPPLRKMPNDIAWLWRGVYFKLKAKLSSDLDRILEESRKIHSREPVRRQLEKEEENQLVDLLRAHPLPGNLRDIRAVALQVIGILCDPTMPKFKPDEVIDRALSWRQAAMGGEPDEVGTHNIFRAVALSFALGQPLNTVINSGNCLDLNGFEKEVRRYLAEQIFSISRERGVAVEKVCTGKTARSLYDWKK